MTTIASEWIVALLYPLLAIAPNPLALGLVRTLMSATVSISNTMRLSYQIAVIPDALQGRVNSVTTLVAYGSLPIGYALTGLLLQAIGPVSTVLGISACLFVTAASVTVSSALRRSTSVSDERPES